MESIVVGGISAALQGVPLNTFDLDIVHSRNGTNRPKLIVALEDLDAVYRFQPERRLKPGFTIRILNLETQIAVKEEVGPARDLAILPLLRRILQERPQCEPGKGNPAGL